MKWCDSVVDEYDCEEYKAPSITVILCITLFGVLLHITKYGYVGKSQICFQLDSPVIETMYLVQAREIRLRPKQRRFDLGTGR